MGERRESAIGGKAEPLTWPQYFRWINGPNAGPEPSPEKFAGKWFDGEEAEGHEALVLKLYDRVAKERHAEYIEKTGFKGDNIAMTKYLRWTGEMAMPRPVNQPQFTDFKQHGYTVAYDIGKFTHYLLNQWNHCVGNLGEDHPTCQKAHWMYVKNTPPPFGNFYEEMGELGHWDMTRKWGSKPRRSFLPNYQPVKQHIPGAYEYFRSKTYLEAFDPEGEGEIFAPITYVE